MGELKLRGIMQVVKDLNTDAEVDILRDYLLTDPLKITHLINFWKGESQNASDDEKIRISKMIADLKNHLMNQANLTMKIYSFNNEESTSQEATEVKSTNENNTAPVGDPSDVLHIVKDGEDKALRERYAGLIKKVTIEDLKILVQDLYKEGDDGSAVEVANFILSQGLYTGKKVKQWSKEKIDNFLTVCKPKSVEDETDNVSLTDDVNLPDEDLYKKYAQFVGDHAPTKLGLRAEVKFALHTGDIDRALELGTFMLSEGLCNDCMGEKFTNAQIEDWFKEIKEDLVKNPLSVKNHEGGMVDDKSIIDTSEEKEKADSKEAIKIEKVNFDIKIGDFYTDIRTQVLTEDITEEGIKTYILNYVKTKKVENLLSFYNVDAPQEAVEKMYVQYFLSVVDNLFKEKGAKAWDMKEKIATEIQKCITNKEKGLGKAMQIALSLYRKRGETVLPAEVKKIVYGVAEERFPDYFKELSKTFTIPEEKKITTVENAIDFPTKYPEIWETVKDAKNLNDVYSMARELEKTQSFMVVSEMIIHLISSGKINDQDGKLITWELAPIEMWINQMFTPAPTVAELTTPVVKVPEVKVLETTAPVMGEVTTPTEEVKPDGVVNTTGTLSDTPDTTPNTDVTSNLVGGIAVQTVHLPTIESIEGITYPTNCIIPKEMEPFRDLYALKNEHFWLAFKNSILMLQAKGKTKKDITHDLADVIKKIATSEYSSCHARNFKKTNISELYKVINGRAQKYEIPGWVD